MSKRPRLKRAIRLTITAFNRHNASRFGAALAFYMVFSLAPMLLIAIAIGGALFGRARAEQEILERVASSFGSAAGSAIAAMIKNAAPLRAGWLAPMLAFMSLYFGLTGVYRQIEDALRTIWRGQDAPAPAITIRERVASLVLVFAVIVVLSFSVLLDAATAMTGRYASARLAGGEWLWHVTQLLVSTLVMTALFAAVFRFLPEAKATWRDVRVGAFMTAILFVIGKFALGFYLGKAAVGSPFGAAGSIVVVLLWAYWSAQIFFFGLEFAHVYAQEREG